MRWIVSLCFAFVMLQAGFNPHLLENRTFPLIGKLYYYPFYPKDSNKSAYNWVLQTPKGTIYRFFGTKPTEDNVFGWSKTDKITRCPPRWAFYYIGDLDGDGDTRFDYIVTPALEGEKVYKMLPVPIGGFFKYEDLGYMHFKRDFNAIHFFKGFIKYLGKQRSSAYATMPNYLVFESYAEAKEAGFDYPIDFNYHRLLIKKITQPSGANKLHLKEPKFLSDSVIEVDIDIEKPAIGTTDMAYYALAFGVSDEVKKVIFKYDGKEEVVMLKSSDCKDEPEAAVCGRKQIACLTTPCEPLMQTYRNYCELKSDLQALFVHTGSCLTKKEIDPLFVAQATWQRGVDLVQKLLPKQNNLFFSPLSIYASMQMLYIGAAGQSKRELGAFLGDDEKRDTLASFAKLLQTFNSNHSFVMSNSVWIERSFRVYKSYRYMVQDLLQAFVKSVDFVHNFEGARAQINNWVAQVTREKIQHLLPPGSIHSTTRLVLVNALYFYGKWQHAFPITEQEPFFTSHKRVDVAMMQQKDLFFLSKSRWFRALELPYKDKKLSMWLFLPQDGVSFSTFLQKLSSLQLQDLLQHKKSRPVFVKLPRFSFSWGSYNIKDALGMPAIFDPFRANFSLIAPKGNLFVSGVYHKAFIKVDENGSEAAAATGAVAEITAAPPLEYEKFFCNRPFFFVIVENATTTPLFMGVVKEP